jgi:hypothetical protein
MLSVLLELIDFLSKKINLCVVVSIIENRNKRKEQLQMLDLMRITRGMIDDR